MGLESKTGSCAIGRVGGPPGGWVGIVSTGGALGAMTAEQRCKNCPDVRIPAMYHTGVPQQTVAERNLLLRRMLPHFSTHPYRT